MNLIKNQKCYLEFAGNYINLMCPGIAERAVSSVIVKYNGVKVLCVLAAKKEEDFSPFIRLTVNYIERPYASIDQKSQKKTNKTGEREILISRLIDRCIRPLFSTQLKYTIQISCILLQTDTCTSPDVPAIIGAATVLGMANISGVNVEGFGVASIGDGTNCCIKTNSSSPSRMVIASHKKSIIMMEGQFSTVSIEKVSEELNIYFNNIKNLQDFISSFIQEYKQKNIISGSYDEFDVKKYFLDENIDLERFKKEIFSSFEIHNIEEQRLKLETIKNNFLPNKSEDIFHKFLEIERFFRTQYVVEGKKRFDGRKFNEIRNIKIRQGDADNCNSSIYFSRGRTTVLSTCSSFSDPMPCGSEGYFQIYNNNYNKLYCNYSFFPFSVSEIGKLNTQNRRETGHSKLIWYGLSSSLLSNNNSARIQVEVISCDGSSSMAGGCGGSIAGYLSGFTNLVSGIAVGVFSHNKKKAILTDITAEEDAFGIADLKLLTSKDGIKALQLDVKSKEINVSLFEKMMATACKANNRIYKKMEKFVKNELSSSNIINKEIELIFNVESKENKGRIIGAGGKNLRYVQDTYGVFFTVDGPNNKVNIKGKSMEAVFNAQEYVSKFIEKDKKIEKLVAKIIKSHVDKVEILCLGELFLINNKKNIMKEGTFIFVKKNITKSKNTSFSLFSSKNL